MESGPATPARVLTGWAKETLAEAMYESMLEHVRDTDSDFDSRAALLTQMNRTRKFLGLDTVTIKKVLEDANAGR